jgi:hypothetical protein
LPSLVLWLEQRRAQRSAAQHPSSRRA